MLEIRPSDIHGQGAFASRPIAAGKRVAAYDGRRYSAAQAARRDWNAGLTYVFGLSDGSLIDAAEGGNATRHLNHSCEPNTIAYEEAGAHGRLVIVFYALRDIAAGEELFLDYQLQVDESDDPAVFACACASQACRGTMLGV